VCEYKLKKIDLIKKLSNKTGYSENFSKKIISDLIDIIVNNISTNKLVLKNIGTFEITNKKQRMGRNPKTKEEYIISSRKSIKFTTSKKISDALKNLI